MSLARINSERQSLADELFLISQIKSENEKELQQIALNYEDGLTPVIRLVGAVWCERSAV